MKKNINYYKFVIMSILFSSSLFLPIRVLYLMNFLDSEGSVSVLKAVFAFTVSFAEVPTGVIADKISKKISIMISAILFSVHAVFYILQPNIVGFAIAQIMLGLSAAFSSGADSAYLSDYINEYTNDDYKTITGSMSLYKKTFSAVFMLLSTIIYTIDFRLNFVLTFFFGTLNLLVIHSLPDVSTDRRSTDKEESIIKDYFNHTKNTINVFLKNKNLRKITLYTTLIFSFLVFNFEYYQIVMIESNISVTIIGVLYAFFMLLMGVGAKVASKIPDKYVNNFSVVLFIGAIIVSFLILASTRNMILILVAMFMQQISFGAWGLILECVIVSSANEVDIKSTMLSINSLFMSLGKAMLFLILGVSLKYFELSNIYIILALIMSIVTGLYIYSCKMADKYKEANTSNEIEKFS